MTDRLNFDDLLNHPDPEGLLEEQRRLNKEWQENGAKQEQQEKEEKARLRKNEASLRYYRKRKAEDPEHFRKKAREAYYRLKERDPEKLRARQKRGYERFKERMLNEDPDGVLKKRKAQYRKAYLKRRAAAHHQAYLDSQNNKDESKQK